jgi:hypothetical protein
MVVGSDTTTHPSTLKTGGQTDRIIEAGEKKLSILYLLPSTKTIWLAQRRAALNTAASVARTLGFDRSLVGPMASGS